ncbi:MAG: hypothetical protein U9Q70_12305 [Chloroflexota bacterium]|nr:hypothetical protein [Chloroflexota bacterium]
MMVIAFPFDLRLWTGVDDRAVSDAQVFFRFVERRDLVRKLNRQLSTSAIQDCRLRIPLTQRLYKQLSNTPPWSEVRKGSQLYRLKRGVLALLRNKKGAAGLTLYMDVSDVEHLYTWEGPDGFFSPSLVAMQESWVEMVGVCAFEGAVSARGFDQPVPILANCVVTTFSDVSEAWIARCSLADMPIENEERRIPLLSQTDMWAWERMARKFIWQDERLPYGPIGYCPPDAWKPGERPSHYSYVDRFGGKWKWEGGRAHTERNPFEGHWDVQLPDNRVKQRWVNWIEKQSGRQICTRPNQISHINVEPDGQIVDMTFEWCS